LQTLLRSYMLHHTTLYHLAPMSACSQRQLFENMPVMFSHSSMQ
jgi:hypothetical protein